MAAGVTAPLLMAASGSNASPGHTRARPCQAASLAWARRTRQPGGGSPAPAYAELCAGAYLAGPSRAACAWPRAASWLAGPPVPAGAGPQLAAPHPKLAGPAGSGGSPDSACTGEGGR